jgi:hypothetical protein
VLRRIFGPKRGELTGVLTKLHNKELHDLYSSPSIIRTIKLKKIRWAFMQNVWGGGKRDACRLLIGKPQGKTPLGNCCYTVLVQIANKIVLQKNTGSGRTSRKRYSWVYALPWKRITVSLTLTHPNKPH